MGDIKDLERILMGHVEPRDLALHHLQEITENFSEKRKIGVGGFGVVYRGELPNGISVAVKRIIVSQHNLDDVDFNREVENMMKIISHRNVVRFLGFCSNTHQEQIKQAGSTKLVMAQKRERLLCFEYISNGNLGTHITDELRGLEWSTRYDIINGICRGLHYLHEEKGIIHMDLNPSNIMLDNDNVPKITDFGLSRPDKNTHISGTRFLTRGYCAPEYVEHGETSKMADIYSLGVVIVELVTGRRGLPSNNHNVVRRWRHRWNKAPTLLNYQEHQLTKCMEIAVHCRKIGPKDRPSIGQIVDVLREIERDKVDICQQNTYLDDDLLGIEPLELHFNFEFNKEMFRLVKLTNKTKACFAFIIKSPSKQYNVRPEKGIVPPECHEYFVQISLRTQERAPHVSQNSEKFVIQSTTVGNSFRVENIAEHIFHEGPGEVVDEVHLMVIYEATKSQENCKRRGGTNLPAEAVPKEEKRKIVGSASGKGKVDSSLNAEISSMDINSSLRGKCTTQKKLCILHTIQSFARHYPTNKKYLGDKSRAVDSARGAMGSLLDKLGKLVTEDYNLETNIKRDIESFSEDLTVMHHDLPKLEKLDGAKIWVNEVRELSYHIEDMVDSFLVSVEPDSNRSGFRELTHEGLKLRENGMMTHHQIGDVIRDIKNQVQSAADRQKKYKIDVNNVLPNATAVAAIDPRISGIYIDKGQLIGMEEPREELETLFEEDGHVSELKVVSIFGSGGLGKTTLANAVYDKLQTKYHARAFVSVGQNPDVREVLRNIIYELDENFSAPNLDVWNLRKKVKELLENKRYLIVIDDIWDSSGWNGIRPAFPENKNGSRVMITTRNHNVALACCNYENKYVYQIKPLSDKDSRRLLFRRIFGSKEGCPVTTKKEEISIYIVKRCGGMPLAINSIAILVARDASDSNWEYVRKSLGALIEGNDALENMMQILDLSFIHLPSHLKTCLLYACKYPEDREIDKNDLLRQWVAEGFVSTVGGLDAEDVAGNYFKDLINMCLIQPGEIDSNNEVLSCRVHDIILLLLRSKSTEENFVEVIEGSKYVSKACGQIHRVSVHYSEENMRILETINKGSLEHVRSVLLYQRSLVPYFLVFKYIRVLHLDDKEYCWAPFLDLTGVSRLFLLRYLKVVSRGVNLKLPEQIGDLQQLETIELRGCELNRYPSDIVSLPRLSHLGFYASGIAMPDGIGRLKSLRTLVGVCVFRSSIENIEGLGELNNLRKLELCPVEFGITMEMISRRGSALRSSISRLSASANLRILNLGAAHDLLVYHSRLEQLIVPRRF